jgi:hypothetical protein
MTSADHQKKKLCPFFGQRRWVGESLSSPPKRHPLRPSQGPFLTVPQRPTSPLARLSGLRQPFNLALASAQLALLGPARRLKFQGS